MKRQAVWMVVGLVAVGAGATLATHRREPAQAQDPATHVTAHLQTARFTVDRMTCATCPITVRTAMSGVKGVSTVTVDFDTKMATVTFDPTVATVSQIAAASQNAGFPATPAS
jgi:mercuric ion binding protein